ncbi:LYR motif-containing protein [Aspergillus fischeri NRRL 181]|uniref:Ras guanyl-nucleotide exchange factor RasGEF n=1 Tax=Neosartorya fischeri (strain ATCC 1020 / DSM 3700 / CBS 544.65 / FGSC A1164 / JCM 1740 / NRRL 181 / WB 181) TaxID=331117 RepID=A1D4F4_NEOFI|nr:uncharacterized protein NFIA_020050 [Aspergillus fischeri NRRL 181]EAW23297.1 hypothetical protein NFIA_020050 [Aspergillus fischeri NRRL 181]
MTPHLRSTYRAILRELPRRTLSNPTPLQQRIREAFRTGTGTSEQLADTHFDQRVQEAEQMAQYARAQRTYAALVERYNPGMTMTEKEKIRLTARRVGFDLPIAEEGGKE